MKKLNFGWKRRENDAERRIFDEKYYLDCNKDVRNARIDPFDHFMTSGWAEGRNASPSFFTLFYRDAHLAGQSINPLSHFAQIGKATNLATMPQDEDEYLKIQASLSRIYFTESMYIAQVGNVIGDPLVHYLRDGWRHGYTPSAEFDSEKYFDEHLYIEQLRVSPLYHFSSQTRLNGQTQPDSAQNSVAHHAHTTKLFRDVFSGNTAEPVIKEVIANEFDVNYYLSRNVDVGGAGLDPLNHYIEYGWRERRKPNRLFDPAFYISNNPEVALLDAEPFFHYLRIGRKKGQRGNPIGSRLYPMIKEPKKAAWDTLKPAADMRSAECVVIMPVYKGRDETLGAIFAVLAATQRTPYALLIVNDSSPDVELTADLAALAARGLFSYVVNETNLGFVRTANEALRLTPDQHAVLLNTDALVSGDWLDRMLRHFELDPTIGTITPFSNNATIFSYPLLNENNDIEMEHDAAGLDRLAAACNAGRTSDMPTGVGFCFFMSAQSRAVVGLFDEDAFGAGYGEENDFCLRAAKAGFRNVLAEDIFVYHVGQVSFGAADPKKGAPGQKALIEKHPEYPELIRRHLGADQSEIGRIRLDLMRLVASAGPKSVIFVYHALTGGVVTHVQHEERRLREAGIAVVHVRVGVGNRYNIEIRLGGANVPFCPNLRPISFAQFRPHFEEFLGWLRPEVIHVHSLADLEWGSTVSFIDAIERSGRPYRFTVHDYSVVCHRNDLVMPNHRYCGLPDVAVCRGCVATDRSYPEGIDPEVRRNTFARFLEGADKVFAPSQDIADRLHRAGARYAIDVVPHDEEPISAPRVADRVDETIVEVAIIGAIGPHKGSRLLLNLARDAKNRQLPIHYTIIGYSDVSLELSAVGVTESGRYADNDEALAKAASLGPSMIFLPSIWPETYSYTLSLAFALGVLPVVFDLGAPAERIRSVGFGEILPYALISDIKALNDKLVEIGERGRRIPQSAVG